MAKKTNPIPEHIRFAALAVDVVCFRVADNGLEVLLIKIANPKNAFNGKWAHVGGLIEVDETADETVDRLLLKKAGVEHIYKEQLFTFSKINRDPRGRVVSVAFIGLTDGIDVQDFDKAELETKWAPAFSVSKLAYDHDEVTQVAIERLRSKIMYTDIARHLMPREFTLSDLQKAYECVLGEKVDKRNFRKKILSQHMLRDTKKTIKKGVMRPATLYSFRQEK